eukprot:CAMPEP_0205811864 /NCGR_PEP_ID=MMETSP0205-20121125/16148_1 /ASSEMBLY_ACC=CAM_ASM_000278 /TAXON_ID=36767 /ORGANISM="Euplotes focardii, Strain TN1" /LENGTH=206 /DNA_ID=CAMNT_0053091629 /DNA_START=192 /DNA_END=810 /DNA_ORIENTATION=+
MRSSSSFVKDKSNDIKEEDPQDICYNLQYPKEEKASDFLDALLNDKDNIYVTVWYQDYHNQWGQNLVNQDVRGTLWKLVCQYHPQIIYTEVDLSSTTNKNAGEFKDLANKLGVNLNNIDEGPSVSILYDTFGDALRSSKGPSDLIKIVNEYIKGKEEEVLKTKSQEYDIEREVLAMNRFDYYMPSEDREPLPDRSNQEEGENAPLK